MNRSATLASDGACAARTMTRVHGWWITLVTDERCTELSFRSNVPRQVSAASCTAGDPTLADPCSKLKMAAAIRASSLRGKNAEHPRATVVRTQSWQGLAVSTRTWRAGACRGDGLERLGQWSGQHERLDRNDTEQDTRNEIPGAVAATGR